MKRTQKNCGESLTATRYAKRTATQLTSTLTSHVTLVLLFTLIIVSAATAQNVHFSAGVEKTATRCLYGAGLTVESKGKWGLGGFYQAGIINNTKESLKVNDAFYGLLFQIPLAKSQKIDFFATARLGIVNENFFVFVPGLETRIKTWRRLSTTFCMGYRVGYPSIGMKVSHPLF